MTVADSKCVLQPKSTTMAICRTPRESDRMGPLSCALPDSRIRLNAGRPGSNAQDITASMFPKRAILCVSVLHTYANFCDMDTRCMPLARSNFPPFATNACPATSIPNLQSRRARGRNCLPQAQHTLSFFSVILETFPVLAEYPYKNSSARIVRCLEIF